MINTINMQLASSKIEALRELLAKPQSIVILAHTNPDGDAIGSSLAWAEILRKEGHEVTCIVPNRYPYYLEFMPNISDIVIFKSDGEGRAKEALKRADIIFCLDFHLLSRLDQLGDIIDENQHAKRVLIDTTSTLPRISISCSRIARHRAPATS